MVITSFPFVSFHLHYSISPLPPPKKSDFIFAVNLISSSLQCLKIVTETHSMYEVFKFISNIRGSFLHNNWFI